MLHAMRQLIWVQRRRLVRLAIIAALAVALLGVTLVTLRMGPGVALAVACVPVLIMVALNQLEYSALLILFVAAFVRFTLPTGTESKIVASMALTAVLIGTWLLRMLTAGRRLRLVPSRANAPLFAFVGVAIFSYLWSLAFRDPLVVVWQTWPFVQLATLATMVLLPGALLLTANTIGSLRTLKALTVLVLTAGCIYLLGYYLTLAIPSQAASIHQILALFNAGGLFSMWFSTLAFTQLVFNRRLPTWVRLCLIGVLIAWGYRFIVVGITWLAGWLVPIVAMGVAGLLHSKKLVLVLALVVVVVLALRWDYWTGTVFAQEAERSGYTRLSAYRQNWNVTGKHLLFGTGPAGYAVYYMTYFPTAAMASHSDFIDILAQTGIVGLVSYASLFLVLLWTGYRVVHRLKGRRDFTAGFASAVLAGAVGCVAAMALGTWLIPFVYTASLTGFDHAVYSWIMLGTLVALERITGSASEGPPGLADEREKDPWE